MAQFPITYTDVTPSGRGQNVPLNVDVRSGGEAIAKGLANLAGVFDQISQAKETMDYSTYRRQFHEVTYKAINAHRESNDPEKMREIEEEWSDFADNFGNDNKRFFMYKNDITASLGQTFANQTAAFQANTLDEEFKLNWEKLVEQNDYPGVEILVADAHKNNVKSVGIPAEAENYLRKAKREIEMQTVFNEAMASEDGEKVIMNSALETDDKQLIMDDYRFEKQKSKIAFDAEQEKNYINFQQRITDKTKTNVPTPDEVLESYYKGKISETQKNNLEKMLVTPGADDNDPIALQQAYKILYSDMEPDKQFDEVLKLKSKLKEVTFDGFVEDMYKPATVSNEIYKQYASAITSLKTQKMFSGNITENINLSIKAQDLLRMFAKQNPDATEREYADFFNKLVENQTSKWGIFTGKSFWQGFRKAKGEMRYSLGRNIAEMEKTYEPLSEYKLRQIIERGGRKWRVIDFDTDGEPLVEESE